MHYSPIKLGLLLLFMNFLLFISCRKEDDNNAIPVIELHAPTSNSFYLSGDTIHIVGNISDDEEILSLRISLKNEDNIPIISESVQVRSRTYSLDYYLPISVQDLEGRYYIEVAAYDESDFSAAFRYVNIGNAGKNLSRVFVFTKIGDNTALCELKNDNVVVLSTLSGDFKESAISLSDNRIMAMGEFTGDLYSCDTSSSVIWNFTNPASPSVPFFNDLHQSDLTFVSFTDGNIIGFGMYGSRFFETSLEKGFQAKSIHRHEDQLIIEQLQNSNGQRKLVNKFYPSALFKGDVIYNYGEISSVISIAWDKVLIFSNDESAAYIVEYDSERHYLKKKVERAGEKFGNAIKLDEKTILFCDGTGLSKYLIDQEYSKKVKENFEVDLMRYNAFQNRLWLIRGGSIIELDGNTLSVIREVKTEQTLQSLELFYDN